jgi:hypothetical protein
MWYTNPMVEGDMVDRVHMAKERLGAVLSASVPQRDGLVSGAGDQRVGIRQKLHAVDRVRVSSKGGSAP